MPLLDHFRPPLSIRRDWHSFHNSWATSIASELNATLPEGYFAEPNVQYGIEIDVAAFEEAGTVAIGPSAGWTPPKPSLTIPFSVVTDLVEVLVYESVAGPILAGAIEPVSPANKDRLAHREAFVSKCKTYLNDGLGLRVVDIVAGGDLCASGYRPGPDGLEIWREPLNLGGGLPVMPLWLKAGPCLRVDLESTYQQTRQALRMADLP